MSKIVADAQTSQTADAVETLADESQPKTQQDSKATPAAADGDDYFAQKSAILAETPETLEPNEDEAEPEADATEEAGTQEEVTETTEADATEETDQEDAEEEESSEATGGLPKRKHVNLSRMSEDKAKLVLFLDKNPDVPLDKAAEIVGVKLTIEQKQEAKEEADSGLPKTAAEARTKADELFEAGLKAMTEDLDFTKGAELHRESRKLEKMASELEVTEATARSSQEQEIQGKFEDSKRNAVKYYPATTDPESPLVKKMLELDALFEETGDDRFNDPDKPFLLAKLAARELGIAPVNPNSKKQSPPPATATKKPQSPVQPASGNARTNQTKTREGTLDDVVDNIRDEDDYEAAKKTLLKVAA